ncbi:MAG: DUF1501 domain-containing protein [Planctomycetaceae bacterium]|nr:DUF1501 domain-containing protein [Planctomycetales bacterium]MCB9923146.1 DUF1501 domain-containing protein [Planctomycetaceae bacterium]
MLNRRQMLQQAGAGFGIVGLAGELNRLEASASTIAIPHFTPRAKRVIFLFMNGAPSHVDTFDPKPALAKYEGSQPAGDLYRKNNGTGFMPSPFRFRAHGESGVVMSELFPNLAAHADDLCVLRSMHTNVPNHEPGLLVMNSGNQQPIRPSLGSWCSYGLGSENENLPGFVVLCPGLPVVGPQLWSSSFLPGQHQGMSVDTNDMQVEKLVANLKHPRSSRAEQQRQLEVLSKLNQLHREQRQGETALDAQIRAMELAFNMQREASTAFDVSREPAHVREKYGETTFGQSCLLARRLCENGVRFVQVYYVGKNEKQPWDTHSDNNRRHRELCADSDRATAALLTDLKARGMLEDTLVVWGGEFGRTPYAQNDKKKDYSKAGRDHHHTGFSMFLAGGGVRGGLMYGNTDEFGMNAVEDRIHVHDLHATILHLLGVDHKRLTYRYSGRDFRLTDVHGEVVDGIIG